MFRIIYVTLDETLSDQLIITKAGVFKL